MGRRTSASRSAASTRTTTSTPAGPPLLHIPDGIDLPAPLPPPQPGFGSAPASSSREAPLSLLFPCPVLQIPDGIELPAPMPAAPPPTAAAAAARVVPGAYQHSGTTRHTPAGGAAPSLVEQLYKGGRHVLGLPQSQSNHEASDGGHDNSSRDVEEQEPQPDEQEQGQASTTHNGRPTTTTLVETGLSAYDLAPPATHMLTTTTATNPEEQVSTTRTSSSQPAKDESTRRNRYILIGGISLVVLVIIAIVVGVLLSNEETNDTPTQNTLSMPLDELFPDPQDLAVVPLSTQDAIQSSKSVQFQAYDWLINDPHVHQYSPQQLRQRFALASFYYATDGPKWFYNSTDNTNDGNVPVVQDTWLSYGLHECQWFSLVSFGQVVCHNFTTPANIGAGNPWDMAHFDYKTLVLTGDPAKIHPTLEGTLVPELAMLTSLQRLALGNQRLKGSIPMELAQLSSTLSHVILYRNYLEGTIPSFLFEFTKQLWMTDNPRLDPTSIPTSIGSRMTSLLMLHAGLTGTIPTELARATGLQQLLLGGNDIGGPFMTELGLLQHLQVLDVAANQVTGPLPSELAQLSLLRNLSFAANSITGGLPMFLADMSNLQELDGSSNPLGGSLTFASDSINTTSATTIPSTWPKLQELKCASCWLTGSITSEVGLLSSLQVLKLGGNKLESAVPSEVGLLQSLQVLWLGSNNLDSTLPTELAQLNHLTQLRIPGNFVTGIIPTEIGGLGSVEAIRLQDNQLSSVLPSELALLSNLKELFVQNNNLIGPVPTGLCNIPELDLKLSPLECP